MTALKRRRVGNDQSSSSNGASQATSGYPRTNATKSVGSIHNGPVTRRMAQGGLVAAASASSTKTSNAAGTLCGATTDWKHLASDDMPTLPTIDGQNTSQKAGIPSRTALVRIANATAATEESANANPFLSSNAPVPIVNEPYVFGSDVATDPIEMHSSSKRQTILNKTAIPSSRRAGTTNAVIAKVPTSNISLRPTLSTNSSKSQQSSTLTGHKPDKGLRHFSARVCAKVEEKGITTYNEVADELVVEIGQELGLSRSALLTQPGISSTANSSANGRSPMSAFKFDHKNIRRRVYDALNVLMAIDIIKKDRKEIRWLGLPDETAQDLQLFEAEKLAVEKRIADKEKHLGDLVSRFVALKNLVKRNAAADESSIVKTGQKDLSLSQTSITTSDRLPLPFIFVNAPKDCRVHCEMLEDRTQYFFEFDAPFFINEDMELLKLMGMNQATFAELKAWLSPELVPYATVLDKSHHGRPTQFQPISNVGHGMHGNAIDRMALSSPVDTAKTRHLGSTGHRALPEQPYCPYSNHRAIAPSPALPITQSFADYMSGLDSHLAQV